MRKPKPVKGGASSMVRRKRVRVPRNTSSHCNPNKNSDQRGNTTADFRKVPLGTLVKRSALWLREVHGRDRGQLGIVTDRYFSQGEQGRVVCFPRIHWEGTPSASLTHPDNAVLYRRKHTRR